MVVSTEGQTKVDRNPTDSGYPDGFLPLINTTIWDYSFGAGVVKEFDNGLKADLGVVHGGNTFNFNITNSHNAFMGQLPSRQSNRTRIAISPGPARHRLPRTQEPWNSTSPPSTWISPCRCLRRT